LFWKDSRSVPKTALLQLKTLEQRYNLLITVVCTYSLLTSAKLNLIATDNRSLDSVSTTKPTTF